MRAEIEATLVARLLTERIIRFSFLKGASLEIREGVSVMICDEHDMVEYDVEFEPDTFVEVGPAQDLSVCIPTDLIFASYSEAGSWLSSALARRPKPA